MYWTLLREFHIERNSHYTMFEIHRKSLIWNIASEASYVYMVYIMSGQKYIKNAKNSQFSEDL